MAKIRVKPTEGAKVRDPKNGAPIPTEGKVVDSSVYWFRRADCGDVEIETETESKAKPAPKISKE